MAGYRPHYISNYEENSGLETYYEPFLIPEKAFPILIDAFCFRGRVKRRIGYSLLGRLKRVLITASMGNISAAGAGTFTFNIFTGLGVLSTQPNAQLELGDVTTITIVIGAPINQTLTDSAGTGTMTITGAGLITAASINYATGVLTLTFSGAAGSSAATFTGAYFPMLPVTGLHNRVDPGLNVTLLMAFDTIYAYEWSGTQFIEFPNSGNNTWSGTDHNLFWTQDYYYKTIGGVQLMLTWVTNFYKLVSSFGDPIRYTEGATWTNFAPVIDAAGNQLWQARIIIPYKGCLIAFNTWEGMTSITDVSVLNFPQRARWSQQNADPTLQSATQSWDRSANKGASFLDAATPDSIVSAQIIKDTLIVKFTNSSWKINYTGNPQQLFTWQIINSELGTESTFSIVPFDRGAFSISNFGIVTDDTVNVSRIDNQIPDFIFKLINSATSGSTFGRLRFCGVRDYYNELVYWTVVSNTANLSLDGKSQFPDTLLVYNYRNGTYAVFNDSFTCFGYYIQNNSLTWQQAQRAWEDANVPWNEGQAAFPSIAAGNQEGFVEILAKGDTSNDPSLAITAVTPSNSSAVRITVINHNLKDGNFIDIEGVVGLGPNNPTNLNNAGPYYVVVIDANTLALYHWNRASNSPPSQPVGISLPTGGTYLGGGLVTYYNNFEIRTKFFVPYYEQGSQLRIPYIDVLLDTTMEGQCVCNIYVDEDDTQAVNDPLNQNVSGLMGTNVLSTAPELFPQQANQKKIWHRFYLGNICQNFQLQFKMSNDIMDFPDTSREDFTLHALTLYTSPNARLVQ